ncbi:hypothetical protein TcWFU_004900 [Taenia crassiceps]|uniref:Secreted protein n=1 Tax=Taenia crassiceps TaxID=6207 RepID=A0ABR4QGZ3_9CEST
MPIRVIKVTVNLAIAALWLSSTCIDDSQFSGFSSSFGLLGLLGATPLFCSLEWTTPNRYESPQIEPWSRKATFLEPWATKST